MLDSLPLPPEPGPTICCTARSPGRLTLTEHLWFLPLASRQPQPRADTSRRSAGIHGDCLSPKRPQLSVSGPFPELQVLLASGGSSSSWLPPRKGWQWPLTVQLLVSSVSATLTNCRYVKSRPVTPSEFAIISCQTLTHTAHPCIHSGPNPVKTFVIPINPSPFPSTATVGCSCSRFSISELPLLIHQGTVWIRLTLELLLEIWEQRAFSSLRQPAIKTKQKKPPRQTWNSWDAC